MKKVIIIFCAMLLNINYSFSQLTINHIYTIDGPDRYVKLSLSGLKYLAVHFDVNAQTYTYFNLYNPDHSLFKSINIPQFPGKLVSKVDRKSTRLNSSHVSESRMPSSA